MTLFERLMNINNGAAKASTAAAAEESVAPPERDPQDPLEIPRFFRRQVND